MSYVSSDSGSGRELVFSRPPTHRVASILQNFPNTKPRADGRTLNTYCMHPSLTILIITMAFPYNHLSATLSTSLRTSFCLSKRSTALINTAQSRRYTINTSAPQHESSLNDGSNADATAALKPLTPEEMKRNNLITTRLYRILLRSSLRGVLSANSGNTIVSDNTDDENIASTDNKSWILLQPSLDIRKYGHANIFKYGHANMLQVKQGELHSDVRANVNESSSSHYGNTAVKSMEREEMIRAMDVLRFVHTSLGGNDDDDLEDYYLKEVVLGQETTCTSDDTSNNNNPDMNENNGDDENGKDEVEKNRVGAAAGKHAEGHYTQFLDADLERGEGPDLDFHELSKDELDDYQSQHEELHDEHNEDHAPRDPSVLVQTNDIANAIRIAFRAPLLPSPDDDNGNSHHENDTTQSIITRRHRDAIDASSLLSEQLHSWRSKSSICINEEYGVRIVATSSNFQLPSGGGGVRLGREKYKFAYRIRVENVNEGTDDEDGGDAKAVQLLGRTWNIYESRQTNGSLLSKLLEDGKHYNSQSTLNGTTAGDDEKDDIQVRTLVQKLHEPKTGAVGHFPVIRPGEVRM